MKFKFLARQRVSIQDNIITEIVLLLFTISGGLALVQLSALSDIFTSGQINIVVVSTIDTVIRLDSLLVITHLVLSGPFLLTRD